jgi:fimbrial chaperone protein
MLRKTFKETALSLIPALAGLAFALKPMSVTLDPNGYGAAKTFRLENESSNQVAFQVSMVSREMDTNGQETLEPVTNLFTLFPPQGVIAPGQSQSIRLVWRGPSKLAEEQAFRIVAEELPVAFAPMEQGRAQIRLLLRYRGTVYVRPRAAKSDLVAESLTKTATNLWQLTITNRGNAHHNLAGPSLTLTAPSGQKIGVSTNYLDSINGENILPHHTRNFLIALPPEIEAQAYHVRLDENE